VVISVTPSSEADVLRKAAAAGVPARRIGETGGSQIRIAVGGQPAIDVAVTEAERIWSTTLEQFFKRVAA
jgi:hypothetical protein